MLLRHIIIIFIEYISSCVQHKQTKYSFANFIVFVILILENSRIEMCIDVLWWKIVKMHGIAFELVHSTYTIRLKNVSKIEPTNCSQKLFVIIFRINYLIHIKSNNYTHIYVRNRHLYVNANRNLFPVPTRSVTMTTMRMKAHSQTQHSNRAHRYLFDCSLASRQSWPPRLSRISTIFIRINL